MGAKAPWPVKSNYVGPFLTHPHLLLLLRQVTRKEFKFASKHNLPFFFVSAADGTNVVKVFESAILEAKRFKASGGDILSDMLDILGGDDKKK